MNYRDKLLNNMINYMPPGKETSSRCINYGFEVTLSVIGT